MSEQQGHPSICYQLVGDCYRARYFLDQEHIPYNWIDIDKSESARKFVLGQNQGKIIVPTIIFQDGLMLIEPTTNELIN
jgi:glutaredoxin